MQLVLRQNPNEPIVLSLPRGMRIFFFSFSAFLLIMLGMSYSSEESNIGPILMILFCLFYSAYYEAWIFDVQHQKIEYRHGLLFWFKRKTIPMELLESISISRFTKGQSGKSPVDTDQTYTTRRTFVKIEYHKMTLVTTEGELHDVEMVKNHQRQILEEKAEAISRYCKVPVIVED